MEKSLSKRLDAFIFCCAAFVILGSMLSLIGWIADVPRLKDWDGQGITIKPNAVFSVMAAGTALFVRLCFARRMGLVRVLACVPLLLGTLTLLEHLTSWDFGIDTLLFTEPSGERATASPGRMGLPMSTSAILLGVALLASTFPSRRNPMKVVLGCGLTTSLIALLAFNGYLFRADPLFAITRLTAISFQACVMVLALGLGIVFLVPTGPRRLLLSPTSTGKLIRWAMPLALLVPLAMGWGKEAIEDAGLIDNDFGTALRTVFEVILLVGIVWWGARVLLRSDDALRQSERELADFFENASIALHWIAADGTILKANQAEFDLLGYSRDEYIGRNIAEFHVDQPVIQEILTILNSGRSLQQFPARLRRKNGGIRDVLVSSSAYFEDGKFAHSRCVTQDVTERRLAERDRVLLASVVEASDDAIITKTLEGVISSWNAGAQRLYGYTAEEVVGKPIDIIVPPNLRGEERSILDQLRRGNRIDHFETIRMHKNGRRVHVSLTVSPLRDTEGNITGASKIARDITDRKMAEARLMEEKERVQVLADAVPALISYIDKDCHYALVNEAYEKWFQKPRLKIVGRHMRDVLGDAAWQTIHPHIEQVLSGRIARFETEIIYANQPARWIDVTYTPDMDIDGMVRGFVAHVNDITVRKKVEDDLRVNQELAETLIRHLDVGAALIRGSDLRFIMINEGYQAIAPDREFVGRTLEEAWPEAAPLFGNKCRSVLETGKPFDEADEPYQLHRRQGGPLETAYFTWSAHRVRLPGDQGWGLLLSVYETTRRKGIEAALRDREQRFRGIVDQAIAGIAETDCDGRFLTVNDAYCAITGYSRDELLTRRMQDLTHPDDLAGNLVQLRRCLEKREGFEIEKRYVRKDGSDVWVHNSVSPIMDAQHTVTSVVAVCVDISQRRNIENTLRESEERFRNMADNAPVMIWITDPEGACTYLSKSWYEFTGRVSESSLGFGWLEAVHPDDRTRVHQSFVDANSHRDSFRVDYRLRRRDGEYRWTMDAASPRFSDDGRFLGYIGSVIDLTDRKQAEESVERSLERQQILSDALAHLLSQQDLNGAIRGLFPKVASHLGVDTYFNFIASDPDETLTLHSYSGIPENVARQIERIRYGQAICGTVAQTHQPIIATDIQHSDYDKADLVRGMGIQVYACFPLLSGRQLLGTLSFASRTRPYFTDDELKFLQTIAHYAAVAIEQIRTAEALQRSTDSLSSLVERAPFGVYIVDSSFRIAMLNSGSQARAFRNVNPAVGRDFAEAMRILWPEPVATEVVECFRHTLETGEPYYSKDYIHPRADIDEVESYEWELHRITLPDGQYGVVCYYYESTMLRRAEQALRDSDRKKDEFLAILAHELRNPLAPLRNMLELLKRDPRQMHHQQDALDTMDRQLDQMVRLIDDLLDVSRISKGKIELRRQRCELGTILRQSVESSLLSSQNGTHNVSLDLPAEPIHLHGDQVRLTQVFANLLSNACKYTEHGGSIRLSAAREGAEVVVSVQDNGIGIPPSKLDAIFELFTQVDQSLERSQGGLGIGLTLAKRLVDLHGGTITARSEGPGKGSEFIVRLPLLTESLEIEPAPGTNGTKSAVVPRRILVVDDNEDSARSMAMIMKLEGHETHVAFDGVEALESARTIRPDVALLDIGLPRLNGYELCRTLRKESWGREMVLIALTGWGQEDDRRESHDAGFNAHLVKPVDPDDLAKLLAQFS